MKHAFQVNFLIVGAQNCGTKALAAFLAHHPEICHSPKKELHFFDSAGFDDFAPSEKIAFEYRHTFANCAGQALVGESTPRYLFLPQVAERIYRYNPAIKLIVICAIRPSGLFRTIRWRWAAAMKTRSIYGASARSNLCLLPKDPLEELVSRSLLCCARFLSQTDLVYIEKVREVVAAFTGIELTCGYNFDADARTRDFTAAEQVIIKAELYETGAIAKYEELREVAAAPFAQI